MSKASTKALKALTKGQFIKNYKEAEIRSSFGRSDAIASRYVAIGGDPAVAAETISRELFEAGVISETSLKVVKANAKTIAIVVQQNNYIPLRWGAEAAKLSAAQFRKALIAVKNGEEIEAAIEAATKPISRKPLNAEGIKKRLDALRRDAEAAGIKNARIKKIIEGWLASW